MRARSARANRPRRTPAPRRQLPWRRMLVLALWLSLVPALLAALIAAMDRRVTIEVAGAGKRVSALEVQAAVAAFEDAGFLSVSLDSVRAAAESLAWVDQARVERAFPARIRVTVTEHVAAARWGDLGLLNTRGELFVEERRFEHPELPQLAGPEGSEWRVSQRYLEAYRQLAPKGLGVLSMNMDERGAWDLELTGGLRVRLGRDNTSARLRLFSEVVLPRLGELGRDVAYVDLRYGNGFAIGWKVTSRQQDKVQG